jgi:hypothetical protein
MVCGSRNTGHSGCGMCRTCYPRVKQRLLASLRKRQAAKGSTEPSFTDSLKLAREALAAPSTEMLAKERRKNGRTRD